MDSGLKRKMVSHKPVERHVVNVNSLHNYQEIALVVPTHLQAASCTFTTQEKAKVLAKAAKRIRTEKKKKAEGEADDAADIDDLPAFTKVPKRKKKKKPKSPNSDNPDQPLEVNNADKPKKGSKGDGAVVSISVQPPEEDVPAPAPKPRGRPKKVTLASMQASAESDSAANAPTLEVPADSTDAVDGGGNPVGDGTGDSSQGSRKRKATSASVAGPSRKYPTRSTRGTVQTQIAPQDVNSDVEEPSGTASGGEWQPGVESPEPKKPKKKLKAKVRGDPAATQETPAMGNAMVVDDPSSYFMMGRGAARK